jgi:antitoxin (DNA-binding transcriptional repressor) of toxin-antitoxin stability system
MSVNLGSLFEDSFPKIGVKELRQNASIYLERVKKGERFVITEWGHPVGLLGPITHVSLEDLVNAGFITPAVNPNVDFNKKIIKLPDGVSATDLLLESRRKERS